MMVCVNRTTHTHHPAFDETFAPLSRRAERETRHFLSLSRETRRNASGRLPCEGRAGPDPETGKYVVAKFDPKSVEMFRLMAAKVAPATHFYPVAMLTHRLIPPPKTQKTGVFGMNPLSS